LLLQRHIYWHLVYIAASKEYLRRIHIIFMLLQSNWLLFLKVIQENNSGCFFLSVVINTKRIKPIIYYLMTEKYIKCIQINCTLQTRTFCRYIIYTPHSNEAVTIPVTMTNTVQVTGDFLNTKKTYNLQTNKDRTT